MAVVRRARSEDAPALAAVHIAAWRAAYRGVMPDDFLDGVDLAAWTEHWRRTLDGRRPREHTPEAIVVASLEGARPLGFAVTGPERDAPAGAGPRGELWAINVAPEAWARGLGRLLLQAAEQALRDAGHREAVLWVVAANQRARRFYEHAGWYADGAEKRDRGLGFEVHEVQYARRLQRDPPP